MPLDAAPLSPWLEVLGRLHPLLLHFPIALLLTAALLELLGGGRRSPAFVRATLLCLAVGSLGALLAAASGWYLAEFRSVSSRQASTLLWHRWGGVGVAGVAVLALLTGLLARNQVSGLLLALFRGLLLVVGITTGLVAHLGGQLTWGEEWLTEPLLKAVGQGPKATTLPAPTPVGEGTGPARLSVDAATEEPGSLIAAVGQTSSATLSPDSSGVLAFEPVTSRSLEAIPEPSEAAQAAVARELAAPQVAAQVQNKPSLLNPADAPATTGGALAAAIDFEQQVLPLLSARCVECHGPNKVKGDLRLDSLEHILGGDPEFLVVTAGDPAASVLIERVRLPEGDPDRMPPKGAGLSGAEIELLERWIQGLSSVAALGSTAAAEVPKSAQAAPLPSAAVSDPAAAGSASPVTAKPNAAAGELPAQVPVEPLPDADPAAVERWLARGARLLPLAEGDGALELSLARLPGELDPAWLADLASLAEQLVWLDLSGAPIADQDLRHLASLSHLEHLRLDRTSVTNAGLPALAALPGLKRLNLCSTQIDDQGLELLAQGFVALERLYLWDSLVTATGLEALAKARPGLRLGPIDTPVEPQPKPAESGASEASDGG
jgi:uncharacterized membrane protein/mono/diheme cytochrome c family protein